MRKLVLSIEDNPVNVHLLECIMVHRPKVTLLTAPEAAEGLALAREHRPDLILLDLHLPEIEGDVVLCRLRSAPETADIPVIVISADAASDRIKRLLAAGAQHYLTKPLEVRSFLDLLDKTLAA